MIPGTPRTPFTVCKDCGREIVTSHRWTQLTKEQRNALRETHARSWSIQSELCSACGSYRARPNSASPRRRLPGARAKADEAQHLALEALETVTEPTPEPEPDLAYDGGWMRVGMTLRPVLGGRELDEFGERAS